MDYLNFNRQNIEATEAKTSYSSLHHMGPTRESPEDSTSQLNAAEPTIHCTSILVISYLYYEVLHTYSRQFCFCLHIAQLGFRTVGSVSSPNLLSGILTSLFNHISYAPLSVLSSLSHPFPLPIFTSFLKLKIGLFSHTIHSRHSFPSLHSSQLPPLPFCPRSTLPSFPLQKRAGLQEKTVKQDKRYNKKRQKVSY